jgi:hypothetical protein
MPPRLSSAWPASAARQISFRYRSLFFIAGLQAPVWRSIFFRYRSPREAKSSALFASLRQMQHSLAMFSISGSKDSIVIQPSYPTDRKAR